MIANNKKAGFEYHLRQKYEAGLALKGWEVKALRAGQVNLKESYVQFKGGEAFLVGCHMSPLKQACTHTEVNPLRERKLLLKRHELNRLVGSVERAGHTCVPVKLYWSGNRVKLEIALAEGKKQHDKRAAKRDKDLKREAASAIKANNR